jgi:hypothetical protein
MGQLVCHGEATPGTALAAPQDDDRAIGALLESPVLDQIRAPDRIYAETAGESLDVYRGNGRYPVTL